MVQTIYIDRLASENKKVNHQFGVFHKKPLMDYTFIHIITNNSICAPMAWTYFYKTGIASIVLMGPELEV